MLVIILQQYVRYMFCCLGAVPLGFSFFGQVFLSREEAVEG